MASPLKIEGHLSFTNALVAAIKGPTLMRRFKLKESGNCGADRDQHCRNSFPNVKPRVWLEAMTNTGMAAVDPLVATTRVGLASR